MPNNKYVAKDCLAYILPFSDPNWISSPNATDFRSIFTAGDAAKFYVRNLTIETTTEAVDVTGIMQGIVSNADGKFDSRITLSKLVPITSSGIANFKSVPKDILLTLTVYSSDTFRAGSNPTVYATLSMQGYARSVNLTLNVEHVRVDGFGDTFMYKRPTRVNGRARIEGLIPLITQATDENFIFLLNELADRRVVRVDLQYPVGGGKYYYVAFTGGVTRTNINVDNPLRQDLELTSIGFIPTTSYDTGLSYHDPVFDLFAYNQSLQTYTSLVAGVGIVLPPFGTYTLSRRIAGIMGVEELTFNVTEGDVTTELTGVLYNADLYTDAV